MEGALNASMYLAIEHPPPSNSHHLDYSILVGNPYKPSFVTVTGWGVDLRYIIPASYVSLPEMGNFEICLLRFVIMIFFWWAKTQGTLFSTLH